MTDLQKARLSGMTGVGKSIVHKEKGGTGHKNMGKIEDEVSLIVGEYKHVIQKVCRAKGFWDGSTHAYRSGYWTYSGSGKRIVWGQYTQFLTQSEYRVLLQKARDKSWDIF